MFYDQRRQLGTSREYSSRMLADSGSSGGLVARIDFVSNLADTSAITVVELLPILGL
ncbi:unnamed protein product, partial [Didymodactylos carnosus]